MGCGRLPHSARRRGASGDAAVPLEADRGRRELLRPRVARPKFHEPRRLRLRKDSGLCPAQSASGPEPTRTRRTSTSGPSCPPRRQTDRASPPAGLCRARRRTSRSSRCLRPGWRRLNGTVFDVPATFRWSPAADARRYRLQVSQDPTFSSLIVEDVITDSTSFTSLRTYPSGRQPLLARSRRCRDGRVDGRHRADVVDDRDVHPDASGARCRSGEPDERRQCSDVGVGACPGLDLLRHAGAPAHGWRPTSVLRPSVAGVHADAHEGHGQLAMASARELPADRDRPADGRPLDAVVLVHPDDQGAGERVRGHRVASRCPHVESKARSAELPRSDFDPAGLHDDHRRAGDGQPELRTAHDAPAYAAGGTFYWHVAAADDVSLNVGDFSPMRSFTLAPAPTTSTTTTPPTTKASSSITLRVRKLTARVRARGVVMPNHAVGP